MIDSNELWNKTPRSEIKKYLDCKNPLLEREVYDNKCIICRIKQDRFICRENIFYCEENLKYFEAMTCTQECWEYLKLILC